MSRVVYTLYADAGDSSGIGDAISRVTAIAGASTRGGSDANVLAAYYYNGMGRMVIKDLPQPDVRLDYNGGGGNTYVGFDRFGRVVDHLWRDYGASADRERFKHGYDRNSNRTWRDHTNTTTRDGFYTYDGLNRLTDYDRGDLNGTFSAVGTLSFAQKWDLKALGNWTAFKEDANGNGSFTEAGDLNQTRTHNAANEITGITETGGQVAWADPVHDARGNVTSYPKPGSMTNSLTVKYDAWNRLVEIRDGANLVGSYVYDGLGRRITKKTYNAGVLDKTRQFFYTNRWQVIEERVDERTNDLERQYVWGTQYVDELILRDKDTADDGTLDQRHYGLQDANYSLTCIVDTNGDAQERYLYTPYGVRTCLDGSFGARGSSSYDWNIGHQGLMHDTESSLVYNRHRQLHPGLGRFMQRDPIGYVDAANLYQYVAGNPLLLLDPAGFQASQPAEGNSQGKDYVAAALLKALNEHYKKKSDNVASELNKWCPTETVTCDGQTCEPEDCKKQAKELADAIVGVVRRFEGGIGGTLGNYLGNRTCSDWQTDIRDGLRPVQGKFRNEKRACFDISKVKGTYKEGNDDPHHWIEIGPCASKPPGWPLATVIDPWPTAGERIVDPSLVPIYVDDLVRNPQR